MSNKYPQSERLFLSWLASRLVNTSPAVSTDDRDLVLFTLRSECITEWHRLTLTDRKTARDTIITAWAR